MDLVTGAGVTVAVVVPVPRERMWELVTDVERIGEWSPETAGGEWVGDGRFVGHNRFPDGTRATAVCVVTERRDGEVFAWDVLDAAGLTGSSWRYELVDGDDVGTTLVRQSFRHGPGDTGARSAEGIGGRLVTLCSNMVATISAMVTTTGVAR